MRKCLPSRLAVPFWKPQTHEQHVMEGTMVLGLSDDQWPRVQSQGRAKAPGNQKAGASISWATNWDLQRAMAVLIPA